MISGIGLTNFAISASNSWEDFPSRSILWNPKINYFTAFVTDRPRKTALYFHLDLRPRIFELVDHIGTAIIDKKGVGRIKYVQQ